MIDESEEPRRPTRRQAVAAALALVAGAAGAANRAVADKGGGKDNKDKKRNDKRRGKDKSGGSGRKIAQVAKKYEGDRYVWGGEAPGGFDCSGLVWYVVRKAIGRDVGRTVEAQYGQGKKVDRGAWKAGDIVFFENTNGPGLTHNGIYLGGGKFIHAENERTGVIVSKMDSGYYSDHYAGARRL